MRVIEKIFEEYEKNGIALGYANLDAIAATVEYEGSYAVAVDYLKIKNMPDMVYYLGHELSHCRTGATHKLDSPFELKIKNEFKANKYFALNYMPPESFNKAFGMGLRETFELAEWFCMPEWFVAKTWEYYSDNGLLAPAKD